MIFKGLYIECVRSDPNTVNIKKKKFLISCNSVEPPYESNKFVLSASIFIFVPFLLYAMKENRRTPFLYFEYLFQCTLRR